MAFIWDLVLQIERILNIGSLMWPLNDLQAPILAPWYYPIKNGFIIFVSITLQQVVPSADGHLEVMEPKGDMDDARGEKTKLVN